ncbi:putative isochorismatase family protein YddQ [Vanrija pseudolonga]|uniref:Purtative isochorismatase family protein YddQ n=1 Tax=Vanrija pseudolonga TaxID=143232 RepID=A0AAF0Y3X7_9TREE|nr:purtative isochorismatase family protein YddQ [Vanrija pseudolonga]
MSEAKSFRQLAGIPPSTASTKDSVLVIVDAQNEYANGYLAVTNTETSRPAIAALLEKYRAGGGHIVHVVHQVPEGTPVFTPGTELAEEFDELKPAGGPNETVVVKKFPGSFAETNLDDIVKKTGLKKLVLVGYMAHVCISTTARQAAQRGYDVLIAGDAVGDRDIPGATGAEVTKTVLLELGDAFGTVINSTDVQLAK